MFKGWRVFIFRRNRCSASPEYATRPHTGEAVSIAIFSVNQEVKLIDLRNPKVSASPFNLADNDEIDIHSLRDDVRLLELLGKELSRSILPDMAAQRLITYQLSICVS